MKLSFLLLSCITCLADSPVPFTWSFDGTNFLHLEWLANPLGIYKVLQSQSVDIPVSNWFVAYTIIPGGTSNVDAEFSITQYPSSFFTVTASFSRQSMQAPKNLTVTSAPLKKQQTNSVQIISDSVFYSQHPELMPVGWK